METIELLEKIPLLRGWLTRWRNVCAKRRLLKSYQYMTDAVARTPIATISFDASGCIYRLDDGRRFVFRTDKAAGWLYSIPYSGSFEEKETNFVKKTIRKDWVCLDVGGCFGWYSVLLSNLIGPQGKVYVFEPVPDNRECLLQNIELNSCTNVVVHPYALGEKAAETTIYVPVGGVSGSLRAHARLDKCKAIDIRVSTLDAFAQTSSLSRLDFIKADIEGAEFLLLQGGLQTLKEFKPILMLEIQAHSTRLFGYEPKEVFMLLREIGYVPYWVDANANLAGCDESILLGAGLPDYNFIFVHRGLDS